MKLDLKNAWHDHEDPTGYRVIYVYEDEKVIALRLVRIKDDKHLGNFNDVASLLTAVENDQYNTGL